MSYLDEQTINAIEKDVTKRLVEHFKIDVKTLLFDATNFDTYIDTQTPGELVQRGHAKSKRKDLRIQRTKKQVGGKERTIVITRSENLLTGQLAGINKFLEKKRAELARQVVPTL